LVFFVFSSQIFDKITTTMAASSGEHHQPVKEQEEGGVQEHEDEAGWVEAHTDCAHLNKVTSGLENLARFDAPCSK